RASKNAIYDLFYRKPETLLTRAHVFEVSERLAASGKVVDALDEADVLTACEALVAAGIESVAVCLLYSYANPAHERRIAELIGARYPNIPVSLSSDIAPEHREYERTSTTVISAYLRPAIDSYLGHFEKQVSGLGLRTRPLIMQSNGGVVPVA